MKKITKTTLGLIGGLCVTTNVYANDVIYGEDIPKGKEDSYEYLEDEIIKNAYENLTKEEANELKVSLESDGYTTVLLRSYYIENDETTKTIKESFDSYEKAKEYIKSLEEKGIKVEEISFDNDTDTQTLEKTYDSYEKACKALEEFEKEYNKNFSSDKIKENKTTDVLGTITDNGPYDDYNAASAALNAFLNSAENKQKDFYFTGTISGPKVTGYEEENITNKHFTSEDEAHKYLEDLKNQGYKIITWSFTNDFDELSKTETYNKKEDAENKRDEYKSAYPTNFDSTITPIANSEKDKNESFNQTFTDGNEAQKFLNSKLALNSDTVKVTGTSVETKTPDERQNINRKYDSKEAASTAKANLPKEYEEVISSEVKEIKSGGVKSLEVYKKDQTQYTVNNAMFVIIKQGGNYYVWTEKKLTSDQITEFKKTYKEQAIDPVITGDLINQLSESRFIYGYDPFGEDNNKTFSFETINGTTTINMARASKARVLTGTYYENNEYYLVATVLNYSHSWNISGNIYTKGFDYELRVSGKKKLDSGNLNANIEKPIKKYFYDLTKYAKTYDVKATGTKELESGTLTAKLTEERYAIDLIKKKYEFVLGEGDGEDPEFEETNPQTGDNITWYITLAGVSSFGIASSALYLRKQEDEKILL